MPKKIEIVRKFKNSAGNQLGIDTAGNVCLAEGDSWEVIVRAKNLEGLAAKSAQLAANSKIKGPERTDCENGYEIAYDNDGTVSVGCNAHSAKEVANILAMSRAARK